MHLSLGLILVSLLSIGTAAEISYEVLQEVRYGPKERNEGDLYLPENPSGKTRPAVIGIHGGGWGSGNKNGNGMRFNCELLASNGFVCYTINYTLGQAATGAVPDAFAAIRFLRKNAAKYKINPDAIGAMGASAGGWSACYLAWSLPDDSVKVSIKGSNPKRDTIWAVDPHDGPHHGVSSSVQALFLSSGLWWRNIGWSVFNIRENKEPNSPQNLPPVYMIGGDVKHIGSFVNQYNELGGGSVSLDTLRAMKHAPGLKGKEGKVTWDVRDNFIKFFKKHLPFEGQPTAVLKPLMTTKLKDKPYGKPYNVIGQTLSVSLSQEKTLNLYLKHKPSQQ